jgi:hypothetical protein
MAKAAKAAIGANVSSYKPKRNRRRSLPKPLRHSKSLGPKSGMRGDRGKQ